MTVEPPKPDDETLHATLPVGTPGVAGDAKTAFGGPQPGDRVGRYVLGRELGVGGMGVVMAAYDEKLDRTVALKLLRSDADQGVKRLLREAQALAMLQHPGVITVFEVGVERDQHYIVMEYVQGKTLKRWRAKELPDWRRVLEVLTEAGRGLAAAHEVGLVHRDVKPGNILVGDDGRARVVDFGIATPRALGNSGESILGSGDGELPLEGDELAVDPAELVLGSEEALTQVGQVVGTPAYMAPEQHRGDSVDARSDQFSFCVMAFEVLFDYRPFLGKSVRGIARQKLSGSIEPLPRDTPVPAAIRNAILRGLQPKPGDRWPSMAALLDQLQPRRRGARTLVAAGIGVVAAAGVASYWSAGAVEPEAGCGAEETTWSEERAAGVASAFDATDVAYAAATTTQVRSWLDRYASHWVQAHAALCEAGKAGAELPAVDFDLQMACLKRRRTDLDAVVGVLEHADREIVRDALSAVSGLRPISDCQDLPSLRDERSAPQGDTSDLAPLRMQLAKVRALRTAGKFDEGLAQARSILADVPEGVPGLAAEAGLEAGRLASKTGDFALAESAMVAAYHTASNAGDDRLAATIAGHLAYVVGYRQARLEDGRRWGRYADAAAERSSLDPLARAMIQSNVASIHFAEGNYEAAAEGLNAALEVRREQLEPGHPELTVSVFNLAGVWTQLGKYALAEPLIRQVLEIWTQQFGPHHPFVANALTSLAAVHEGKEEYAKAIPLLERALSIREAEHGPEHPDVATVLDSLASVMLYAERYTEAEAYARRGKTIRFAMLPDPHPYRAASLTNLGMALAKLERFSEADPVLRDAIEAWARVVGDDHPHSAFALTSLGLSLSEQGEHAEAVQMLERAAQIRQAASVPARFRLETVEALERARERLAAIEGK